MQKLQRILVAIDFSECSRAALESAAAFAEPVGAFIDVLHVWEGHGSLDCLRFDDQTDASTSQGTAEFARTPQGRKMTALIAELRARGFQVAGTLTSGEAADAILRRAERSEVDLIVLGTHGRAGLPRLVLGSVAQEVVRRAVCPVLTVHASVLPQGANLAGAR